MSGKIKRSAGYPTGVAGFIAGSGYEGLTDALDNSVKKDAEWLAEEFPGYDVEIRFNSDRRSGGAFLAHLGDPYGSRAREGWKGIMLDSAVGINTGIDRADESKLVHSVFVDHDFFNDPDATIDSARELWYRKFPTNGKARKFLLDIIDRDKIPPPTHR